MDAKTSAAKRARVLSAAEAVFLRQGFGLTTMGDLAAAAGMSRPALYLVYARKQELFAAILHEEARSDGGGRAAYGDSDGVQHWMTWVCDLWLGEVGRSDRTGATAAASGHQRSEGAQREAEFLQALLQQGLSRRLAWAHDGSVCNAVARLLTFCVLGLLESRADAVQRKALLSVQIDALADAAMRPVTPSLAGRAQAAKRADATLAVLGAN